MKVVIHSISAIGYDPMEGWDSLSHNIRSWQPMDTSKFVVSLVIALGDKGKSKSQGSDDFHMYVATPSGLAEMEETEGVVVDGHLLVVNEYDWKLIWNNIENKVSKCDARTWIACGEWLTRYFDWEFENYKPS